jgi:hypothetical protein
LEAARQEQTRQALAGLTTGLEADERIKAALLSVEERFAALEKRADAVAQAEVDLIERQTAWEHKQALIVGRQVRLENDLKRAEAQAKLSEQQVARLKEELERVAGALIDDPDPPLAEALTQAA